ncbi:LacI family DNA-binding transcriptional regulator [Paraclostridium ghonii]|uniref:DNA-binding LacI/PurR family transcriptional regulator n=1 Tax=Paraclostridium ghonii TaxID=29358 RepID=A0ABU0MXC9_9FIRM|nr:LacI family DNA-binding transcriptional regulator [Paeniclostridium ghonii]MDQ0555565.1 DNA-binding LacI/PurR family transcriptional regulator [Paeniclostridium ghonii]
MKITIKDVAKEANVATSTVSRVLSNNPRISEETKKIVNKAIKKLNYKPNPIARSLVKNKTRILGVVLPSKGEDLLTNPFFINAMKGMSMYAQSKNYYITYAFSKNEKTEAENIKEMTTSNLVDGVILLRAREKDESVKHLKEIKFPFVLIGRPEYPNEVLWVDNNNFQAMYRVVDKLIKKGHKKIGFVGSIKNLNMSKDRFKGYQKALEINNIDYDESIVIHKGEFKEHVGEVSCSELLENEGLTAIVTTDDLIAIGVLKELKERKIKNISVVGFNNTKLAQYQKPSLASVDINADELGYQAAKLLIDNLEGNNEHISNYIVSTEFIERQSF